MFFSVIVPIYKVEDYLESCIESVLNQTFADFELILVDDGSPDRCPEICDEYKDKDKRVRVIHKENGGLVSARQAGIKIAKGEYVLNLDADDSLSPDALKSANKIIADTNADIVSFSYGCVKQGEVANYITEPLDEGLYNEEDIKKHIFPKLLVDENMQHMSYYLAGKVIRRSLVTSHQLNVDKSISLGEDLCCLIPCYQEAEKVYISKEVAYLYTIRADSMTYDFNVDQIKRLEKAVKKLHDFSFNNVKDFKQQIARYFCFMCFSILADAAEGNHFNKLKGLKKLILNSPYKIEIKKSKFSHITIKSRVAIFLIKINCIRTAFYFLNLCKMLKCILGKKRR